MLNALLRLARRDRRSSLVARLSPRSGASGSPASATCSSVSQDAPEPVRPDIPFAPLTDDQPARPRQPDQDLPRRHGPGRARLPADAAPSSPALTPANLLALNQEEVDQLYGRLTAGPIPDGAYLGDLFFSRGDDAAAAARGDPRRHRGPRRGREDRARRGAPAARSGRARCSTATSASSGTSSRTSAPLDGLIDDPDALEKADGAARGLAPAHPADHRRLAAVPGQALLRPEPARRPARVGDHRLCLQRRAARLPGEPGRAGRPQRPAHPRRDPDDPARASTWAAPTPTRSSC